MSIEIKPIDDVEALYFHYERLKTLLEVAEKANRHLTNLLADANRTIDELKAQLSGCSTVEGGYSYEETSV